MLPDVAHNGNQAYVPASNGKRRYNFDEIDNPGSDFSTLHKKNFDEIDHSGSSGFSGFQKKNFDEIDHASSSFSGFQKKNFDEIDNANFGGFSKRDPLRFRY